MSKRDQSPKGSIASLLKGKTKSSCTTPRSSSGSLMDHPLPDIDATELALLNNRQDKINNLTPVINDKFHGSNASLESAQFSASRLKNNNVNIYQFTDINAKNALDTGETSSEDDEQNTTTPLNDVNFKSINLDSQQQDLPIIFVETPSKRLFCLLCNKIFTDPVIVSCGHTFCKSCVKSQTIDKCPVDSAKLEVIVNNLAVSEQIGELLVRCKYGCKRDSNNFWELDNNGCLITVRLIARKEHEDNCDYRPMKCPNNPNCPTINKKDLQDHLLNCQYAECPHKKYGCEFSGTSDELAAHMANCQFENVKDYLKVIDTKMNDLEKQIISKDQDIGYFRSMLSNVCQRMDDLETSLKKHSVLSNEKSDEIVNQIRRHEENINTLNRDLVYVMDKVNQDAFQVIKCKGTLVGHAGPVWCLYAYEDYLFSGSSDKTIKVWDTNATNYTCLRTLSGHNAIVLAICACSNKLTNKLFSGSQDRTIITWNLQTLDIIEQFEAHKNPVCTLTSANNMLFSGSLKEIAIWEPTGAKIRLIRDITGLDHWVRAMFATNKFLYASAYETIKVFELTTLNVVQSIKASTGSIYSLTVTDKYIICGNYERDIHVWETNGKIETTLKGHSGTIFGLETINMPTGMKLISASNDQSLRVWSLDNLICTQTLLRHQSSVASLAVSRGGRIFSGAIDGEVKVWQ